ncbi:MAG: hypothetical protein RJA98_2140 [Pseudomonadota bacterium]|jgi:lambda family phage portal protein
MTHFSDKTRARLREPGSVILRDFRAAMEAKRAGGAGQGSGAPLRYGQQRSFSAAQASAFTSGWHTNATSLNQLLQTQLPILVQKSRHWSRNTGAGRKFLKMVRDNGVGPTGYPLRMACGDWRQGKGKWVWKLDKLANDAIEAAWADWCNNGCEVTGRLSFAEVCKLQLEHCAADGEYLTRKVKGRGAGKYLFQLQLLHPSRLDVHHNETPRDGREVRMGVHRDSAGKTLAYSLLRSNPGEMTGTRDRDVVPADQVLHDFVTLEAEQARGVPWSHAVLVGANMLAQFSNFAMFAAQIGASQMGFLIPPKDEAAPFTPEQLGGVTQDPATGQLSKEMAPGALDQLPPGYDFKQFDSKYPSESFDPFTKAHRREIASGLGVADHNLSGDMEGVNYSSARIAELAERDGWRSISLWYIHRFVRNVFKEWLEMALLGQQIKIASGQPLSALKIDKYLSGAIFTPRGWAWVDPLKEVNAHKIAREEGFETRTQIVAEAGGNFEDNVAEMAQEQALMESYGVTLGTPAPAAAPGGKPKPPADGEDPADDEDAADKPDNEQD